MFGIMEFLPIARHVEYWNKKITEATFQYSITPIFQNVLYNIN